MIYVSIDMQLNEHILIMHYHRYNYTNISSTDSKTVNRKISQNVEAI